MKTYIWTLQTRWYQAVPAGEKEQTEQAGETDKDGD